MRELGEHPDGGIVALCRGRYGPYVSHAGVFASLPRNADPDAFSLEQALELLAAQQKKGKSRRRRSVKTRQREATTASGTPTCSGSDGESKGKRAKAPATSERAAELDGEIAPQDLS